MYYRQLKERQFVTGCNLIFLKQINTLLRRTYFADISRLIVLYLDCDLMYTSTSVPEAGVKGRDR